MTQILLASLTLLTAALPAPDLAPGTDPVLAELLEAHNRERAKENKPPLVIAPKLVEAAKAHAVDMAKHDKMSHEGSDGSDPAERVKRQDYRFLRTGENVAYGQPAVAEVVEAWMNSPHHRENILGDFAEMGGARVEGGEGTPYWCVVFGTPLPRLDPTKAASDLVDALNKARAEAEARPLKTAPELAETAQARRYESIGQSLASGYPTAREAVASLLESPDQKTTLLGNFDEIGVGYANAEDGTPYWCMILARSRR